MTAATSRAPKQEPAEPRPTRRRSLPGDLGPEAALKRMLRVDHAGEYGARRIYEGQIAVLGRSEAGPLLRHMYDQEKRHLEAFERLLVERRARPTLFQPLWHIAGFALGAGTALMGEKAAMACTVAVEEVIDRHYRSQLGELGEREPALAAQIEEFRAEEVEHRDLGLEQGAEQAPGYPLLTTAIKAGSRVAIWLSERV